MSKKLKILITTLVGCVTTAVGAIITYKDAILGAKIASAGIILTTAVSDILEIFVVTDATKKVEEKK